MWKSVPILLVWCGVIALAARAQEPLAINLATSKATDTTVVPPGRYSLRLTNRLPQLRYTVSVSHMEIPVEPIPITMSTSTRFAADPCARIKDAVEALKNAKREEDIPGFLAAAETAAGNPGNCPDSVVREVNSLRDRTLLGMDTYTLKVGQYLRVSVHREAQGAIAERSWLVFISTGPRGQWQVTYGLAVPWLSSGEDRYFLRQVDTTGKSYTIQREQRARHYALAPVVLFSFMPAGGRGWTWNVVSAGLGGDLTKPSLYLGLLPFTYNSNLQVTAGVTVRLEPSLLGRYAQGDTVRTNFTFDQLHENVYRVRPFVSVTFRFSKDPFGLFGWASGGEAKPDPKAPPAPKPASAPQTHDSTNVGRE